MSTLKFVLIQATMMVILCAGAWYPVTNYMPPGTLTFVLVAICLSAVSGMVAFAIVSSGLESSIRFFTTYIIGSMLAKMMIGLSSIFLVALKFKPFSTVYVLTFFFCYFVFTSFEVYALMRKLRPISTKGKRDSHDKDASK